jgi:hypothetical protein
LVATELQTKRVRTIEIDSFRARSEIVLAVAVSAGRRSILRRVLSRIAQGTIAGPSVPRKLPRPHGVHCLRPSQLVRQVCLPALAKVIHPENCHPRNQVDRRGCLPALVQVLYPACCHQACGVPLPVLAQARHPVSSLANWWCIRSAIDNTHHLLSK